MRDSIFLSEVTFSPAVRVVSDLPSCGFFYRYVLTQKVEASWPSSLHLDICSDCRCFGPAGSSLAIALIPETRTLVAATHCWGEPYDGPESHPRHREGENTPRCLLSCLMLQKPG